MSKQIDPSGEVEYSKYAPFMDRDYNMFMLLGITMNAIFRARHYQVEPLGITPTEFHLLLLVAELGDSAFPAELSRWLKRKPPTVSKLLDRMERNGLIKRVGHPNNSKIKRIVMTEKGQTALEQARAPDVMRLIMAGLSDEEFHSLWALLEKLRESALIQAEAMKIVKQTGR